MLLKHNETQPSRYIIEETESQYEIEEDMINERSLGDFTEDILRNYNTDD